MAWEEEKPKVTLIKVVCAWCGTDMGTKDGKGQEGVSHGICSDCYDKVSVHKPTKEEIEQIINFDYEQIVEDKRIADNMRDVWANQNAGSCDWRG